MKQQGEHSYDRVYTDISRQTTNYYRYITCKILVFRTCEELTPISKRTKTPREDNNKAYNQGIHKTGNPKSL